MRWKRPSRDIRNHLIFLALYQYDAAFPGVPTTWTPAVIICECILALTKQANQIPRPIPHATYLALYWQGVACPSVRTTTRARMVIILQCTFPSILLARCDIPECTNNHVSTCGHHMWVFSLWQTTKGVSVFQSSSDRGANRAPQSMQSYYTGHRYSLEPKIVARGSRYSWKKYVGIVNVTDWSTFHRQYITHTMLFTQEMSSKMSCYMINKQLQRASYIVCAHCVIIKMSCTKKYSDKSTKLKCRTSAQRKKFIVLASKIEKHADNVVPQHASVDFARRKVFGRRWALQTIWKYEKHTKG